MTIADLIMRRGDIAARGAERSGAIWGNAVADLGGIAAGAIQQHGMQKQAQERQVAFDEALQSWDPADPNQSFMRLARVAGPEPAMQITRGLMAITESQQRQAQGEAPDPELFGQKIGGLLAMRDKMGPDYLRERWDQIQPHFAPDVKALFGVELGPEYTEEYDQQLTALGEQFSPQPQGGDFTLSPGQTRFGAEGEQIAAVAPKPEKSLEEEAREAFALAQARARGTASVQPPGGGGKLQYYLDRESGRHVQLTPAEAKKNADRYGRPLFADPTQELEKVNRNLSAFGDIYTSLNAVLDDVGPVTYTINELEQKVPGIKSDPAFRAFQQQLNALSNEEIKRITGAQMSEPEAKRLKKGMADGTLKLPELRAALYIWKRGLERTRASLTGNLERWGEENPYDPTFGVAAADGGGTTQWVVRDGKLVQE
jgi:hypothetical protein